jgi:8-amino-7-oxononanoate synthase
MATPKTQGVPADVFRHCAHPRADEYRLAQDLGLLPFFREMASAAGPTVVHEGRSMVMLGSNNYLGLTTDPRVTRAAIDAVERFGTGCTGSRLLNGTLPLHRQLEEELASWVGAEACLVFTTGYAVNLSTISTLVQPDDAVFVDASSHASILDGAHHSAGAVRYFRHNSVPSLKRRLSEWAGEGKGGALVAVDSVYSMEGDVAPVAALSAACRELGARILVDEAHAIGVLGPSGAGVAAEVGIRADLLMGTFSKSLASCGGFLAGPRDVIDYLRLAARPFLFTASGVPAALAAALAAARVARVEDWRRQVVRELAHRLRAGLAELGYPVPAEVEAAIVPVYVGDDWEAGRLWRRLLDLGVYTNCVIAPAVRRRGAMLRTSVMATHTEAHIDQALAAFEQAARTATPAPEAAEQLPPYTAFS